MEISTGALTSDLERRLKERSALDQLGKTLISNFDLEQLLDAIANTAKHDGVHIPIVLEEEPGSGGKNQALCSTCQLYTTATG